LPVFKVVDFALDNFDRKGSAYRRHTGFSTVKMDFPSPTVALNQLNDGVFHTSVLHRNFLRRTTFAKAVRSAYFIKDK